MQTNEGVGVAPPGDLGRRLLPNVIDEIASTDPERVIYSYTLTKDPADGFRDVTVKALSRAIDRCAWHITEQLGPPKEAFPTIAYMGPQDVVYTILIMASVKAGYKVLLTSLRNTVEAHLHLMEATDCQTFAMPPDYPLPTVKQILAARPMRVLDIPGPEHWLADDFEGADKPFAYQKTYDDARAEPLCVLHTSGSTGMPKPIVQTHGCASAVDAYSTLPANGLEPAYPTTCKGRRVYLGFPLFHAAGIANFISGPVFVGYTSVLGAYPPSPDVANGIHVYGNVQESCLPPTTLVDLSKDPAHLENLSRVERIMTGGGPLPKAVGTLISTKTNILNCIGTTECSQLPVQDCPEDWEYIKLSPCLGHTYRHVSEDLYEQVIVRQPHLEAYQGVFRTFPDLREWPMKDLYSPHPTKKELWLYKGRIDDIIVFSTGEKLNPLDMEAIISSHPAVSACLVSGFGRFQSSLLIEAANPPSNEAGERRLIDEIWPSIQEANASSPSHGRIHRNMITIADAGLPFLRAGKGTVQRQLTLDLYDKELNELYIVSGSQVEGTTNSDHDDEKSLKEVVGEFISTATDINVEAVDPHADLFTLGLDSLQVTVITRSINGLLSTRGVRPTATVRTVYANPTVASLTKAVLVLLGEERPDEASSTMGGADKMEKLLLGATKEMPISGRQPAPRSPGGQAVLLTGGTGTLGSYILDRLMREPRCSRIYCLNRGPDSLKRQQRAQERHGLQGLDPARVTCLDGDITQPHFGLPRAGYAKLIAEVTDVIHSAWEVDFNLSLDSFHGHIQGVRRLVDFSSHSRFGAHIFFISSIGSVSGLEGIVEEKVHTGWDVPLAMGYGQSKFVAERILDVAAIESHVPATVCRVGQIAGPTGSSGMWPKKEWLPSLIASSKRLGVLPDSLGLNNWLDWVPVDIVAQSITNNIAERRPAEEGEGARVCHISNPGTTTWTDLVDVVAGQLGPEIKIVALKAWVDVLQESVARGDDPTEVPAVKLYDFFADLASSEREATRLESKGAVNAWHSMLSQMVVQKQWMENWMRQWAF